MSSTHPVYLVKGDDPSLSGQALKRLLDELLEGLSPELALEDLAEDADLSVVIDAASTPAFLSERRVVLVREAGRFRADEVEPLIAYLDTPMPSTTLVLVGGGGAIPTRLTKAIKAAGHVIDASAPAGKGRTAWVTERLRQGSIRLDSRAQRLLLERLGEELGQLDGILDALAAAFGEGALVSSEQLEPFLGDGGSAAPWELTDAIDSGDTTTALLQLHRMLEGGQRHPLAIMATLQRHTGALLRLDGSEVSSEGEAASLLGMAPFPAKKALTQARRLGSEKIARAVSLVADADVDLRGRSGLSGDLVMEVLVARLSRLAPAGRRR